MTRLRGALLVPALALLGLSLGAAPLRAQQPPVDQTQPPVDQIQMDAPAHVSFVDGAATLERDGRNESAPLNMPLLAGDRLRTQGGRVEVLFGDRSILHVDANSIVDFQSDELVRLLKGRVRLAIPGATRAVSYRIDAPWASAEIVQTGEYRLGIVAGEGGDEIELDVVRGAADLVNDRGRTPLRAGQRAYARAQAAPSEAYVYNSASWDAFDDWSETRRGERLGASAQYLPEDVRPYSASFDTYGSWDYQPSYGYVWYPRAAAGWRPYYNGRWATVGPYGWTWIGADPWAWPTHHYGRWGFSAGAWFWIPGRSWAAAWVSWAYAPGYVSWCPLGWNNRPVMAIGYGHTRGYDPWRAWTAVPDRHFRAGSVHVRRVGRFDLDSRTRTGFSTGTRAPDHPAYAVPRGSAPIHVAGTRRRSSTAPLYTNVNPRDSRVGNAPSRTMVGSAAQPPGEARSQRSGTSPSQPGSARGVPVPRNSAASPPAASPSLNRTPIQRPDYQGRPAYGQIERAPSAATPSAATPSAATPSAAAPRDGRIYNGRVYGDGRIPSGRSPLDGGVPVRGADMGVGGMTSSPDTRGATPPAPAYGRTVRERGADAPTPPDAGMRRGVPRDGGDLPIYRAAPREPRGPGAAPPRPSPPPRASAPESRGADRAPAPSSPPARAGQPRNGGAPAGQAVPRGRGRGGP